MPKGGWPKKAEAALPPKGNPDFTLTSRMEAEALDSFEALADQAALENVAPSAITNEDLEIEQMLERVAKTQPMVDIGPDMGVIHEKKTRDVLRNHVDAYKPAASIMDLEEQCQMAKMNEIDSIEGTEQIIKHFTKAQYEYIKKNVGYFIYKDIRVYIAGYFEQNKNADSLTMEQKLHSKGSKDDTVPIIRPQKV